MSSDDAAGLRGGTGRGDRCCAFDLSMLPLAGFYLAYGIQSLRRVLAAPGWGSAKRTR